MVNLQEMVIIITITISCKFTRNRYFRNDSLTCFFFFCHWLHSDILPKGAGRLKCKLYLSVSYNLRCITERHISHMVVLVSETTVWISNSSWHAHNWSSSNSKLSHWSGGYSAIQLLFINVKVHFSKELVYR